MHIYEMCLSSPPPSLFFTTHIEFFLSRQYSLEKEPARRATPWRMLEHPWMVEMQSKKVNMQHFLAQVWDWKD